MLKKVLIGIVATFLLFMTFMLAVMVPMWEREDAEKAKILAQQRAEILKRNQERFNAMSPKEHLAEAEKIIKTASSGADGSRGIERIHWRLRPGEVPLNS